MGLDMWLKGEAKNGNDLGYELCYWRKANQIRNFFVNNIDDFNYEDNFGDYVVSKELLEKLLKTIDEVLDDHSKAAELLPTSEGFFFGSQDYDEWYFRELEDTKNNIQQILNNFDFEKEKVIYYEWY